MPRGGYRVNAGRPKSALEKPSRNQTERIRGQGASHRPYPTSRYRVFETLEEAQQAVAQAKSRGFDAQIANGFERSPRVQCLWLYTRPNSREDGRTVTVYSHTKAAGLVYLRENGEFQ